MDSLEKERLTDRYLDVWDQMEIASIIIPTRKRVDLLSQCLQQIERERTGFADVTEVIVTDDCPEQSSLALASRFPGVRFLKGPESGLTGNRENGVSYGKGDRIIFIDDDCIPQPGWLRAYLDAAGAFPETAFFGGPVVQDRPRRRMDEEAPRLLSGNGFHGCNFMVRRADLERIGGFNLNFPFYLEDIELMVRIQKHGYFSQFVPEAAVVHPWRRIPSLRGKFQEAKTYRKLLATHPECAADLSVWPRLKIAIGKGRKFVSDCLQFRFRGAATAVIIYLLEFYKVVSVGIPASRILRARGNERKDGE